MNKQRRAELTKAKTLLEQAFAIIEECASEEQDAYDNMPEGLQASERGQAAEQAAADLQEIANSIDEASNELERIVSI